MAICEVKKMTPFSTHSAREYIQDLLNTGGDAVDFIDRISFQIFDELWTDREDSDPPVEEENCMDAWIGCCLVDAVLNQTDYSSDCVGYTEEYQNAVEAIQAALKRKHLLSRKPIHDCNRLRQRASDILMILDDDEGTELGQHMMASGKYEAFVTAIIKLANRIDPPEKEGEYL